VKTVRPIAIADHLWDALERMALEMGADREALVNQALHVFARLNGYLVPGAVAGATPPRATIGPGAAPESAERLAIAEQVLETAARLERAIHDRPAPPPLPAAPADAAGPARLVLVREDGSEVAVAKDRFLIGRGRHCDLVVESAKVSREHAVLAREGSEWWIEDLCSANGTWFRRARVERRRVEDGDEYFVCAERFRCALR
jgi:hypothetical protein